MSNLLGLLGSKGEESGRQWTAKYCCVPGGTLSVWNTGTWLWGQVEDPCGRLCSWHHLPKDTSGQACARQVHCAKSASNQLGLVSYYLSKWNVCHVTYGKTRDGQQSLIFGQVLPPLPPACPYNSQKTCTERTHQLLFVYCYYYYYCHCRVWAPDGPAPNKRYQRGFCHSPTPTWW